MFRLIFVGFAALGAHFAVTQLLHLHGFWDGAAVAFVVTYFLRE
jgi:hypothetical protein